MFDTWKNLTIALFWIRRSFWCLLQTWYDDSENNEINEIWDDYSNKIDKNSRIFKSKRFVLFEESRMNSWKNWFEIIDKNNLKKEL